MAITVKKKSAIQSNGDIFAGISAVYAVKDGLTISAGGALSFGTNETIYEFPVSDDGGFNFDTGAASTEHFKVKGQFADWTSTFTPGDSEITLEVPCHDTDILELVFGQSAINASWTTNDGLTGMMNTTYSSVTGAGKTYKAAQAAVNLGLLILNDTEDKIFFIKKAKLAAQLQLGSDNKPLCVTLTGSIADTGDNAFGVIDLTKTAGA